MIFYIYLSKTIMNFQILFIFLLSSTIFCLEPNEEISKAKSIVFSFDNIKVGDGITLSGSTVLIEKPGIYMATGAAREGNIVIKTDSVKLYLKDLLLSSKKSAPIIITGNKKDIKIINIQNTILNDLEDPSTTDGECAVIKIKKNSIVHFSNNGVFKLFGNCKNIIRGLSQTSIIFDKSDGEYIINANKTAISSDGDLQFDGGLFTIESEYGDAIKSTPEDDDTKSLGKILIKNGIFNVQCYGDAFTAKNNITILKGTFDITTQNGYENDDFNGNISSKGFKVTNPEIGSEIKVYSGDFFLNTADDGFRSNRDITILKGNFLIYSRDDAICAKFHLNLGEKDAKNLDELNIKILYSFEALEGMVIKIYSGKIIATAVDDGINASGVVRKAQKPNNRNWNWNFTNFNWTDRPNFNWTNGPNFNWTFGPNGPNGPNFNWTNGDMFRNRTKRNKNDTKSGKDDKKDKKNNTKSDTNDGKKKEKKRTGTPGNSSYCISIFNGDISVYSESDGIDSNGNIYIHGGKLTVFSKGSGSDSPLDHNGNLTLYNADVLGIGTGGFEAVHEVIEKGNQMYAYYDGDLIENVYLEIRNEKDEMVKETFIYKLIDYIFYSSKHLNNDYHFYIREEGKDDRTELEMIFDYPNEGEDDEDLNYNYDDVKEQQNKNKDDKTENNNPKTEDTSKSTDNFSINLKKSVILYFIYFILF